VTFKIYNSSLKSIRKYGLYRYYDQSDNNKRVVDLLEKFPQLIKDNSVKSDGDISIIIT